MIDEKFLTTVLGTKVEKVAKNDGRTVKYYTQEEWHKDEEESQLDEKDLFELAFACKDRAHELGFELNSGKHIVPNPHFNGLYYCYISKWTEANQITTVNDTFEKEKTELDAIFKAFAWIVEDRLGH